LAIGALGKDGVTSSIYIRALLRGTTLRSLMQTDRADDRFERWNNMFQIKRKR